MYQHCSDEWETSAGKLFLIRWQKHYIRTYNHIDIRVSILSFIRELFVFTGSLVTGHSSGGCLGFLWRRPDIGSHFEKLRKDCSSFQSELPLWSCSLLDGFLEAISSTLVKAPLVASEWAFNTATAAGHLAFNRGTVKEPCCISLSLFFSL